MGEDVLRKTRRPATVSFVRCGQFASVLLSQFAVIILGEWKTVTILLKKLKTGLYTAQQC